MGIDHNGKGPKMANEIFKMDASRTLHAALFFMGLDLADRPITERKAKKIINDSIVVDGRSKLKDLNENARIAIAGFRHARRKDIQDRLKQNDF